MDLSTAVTESRYASLGNWWAAPSNGVTARASANPDPPHQTSGAPLERKSKPQSNGGKS